MTPFGLAAIALTVLFTVIGQILVKQGMVCVGAPPPRLLSWPGFAIRAFTNPRVAGGLASAVVAAFCWVVAVSKTPLSLAYPFMGLAIVLVLLLSGALLSEHVQWNQWLGVVMVCLGLWLASYR